MLVSRFLQFAAVAANLGVVSAQIPSSNLSSSCQSTITSLAASPAASCFNIQGIIPLAATSNNVSIIGPLDDWLSGMCRQPACSNTTVTDLVSNLTNGCTSDLNDIVVSDFTPQSLIEVFETSYLALRELACLTDVSQNNTNCLTETLTRYQNDVTFPVTFPGIMLWFGSLFNGALLSEIPQSSRTHYELCTSCEKEILNIVEGQILGHSVGTVNVTGQFSRLCGDAYVNGSVPSTVSESANNSAQSVTSSGNNSTQPAGGDSTTSFAVVQSPFGLLSIIISSLFAFGCGVALVM